MDSDNNTRKQLQLHQVTHSRTTISSQVKVSQIATLFQPPQSFANQPPKVHFALPSSTKFKASGRQESATSNKLMSPVKTKEPNQAADMLEVEQAPSPTNAGAGLNSSVVRTESHVARFNNARALFEKLGEENGAPVVKTKIHYTGLTNGSANVSANGKPALPRKPEKPERKFNSRELIEKQRNWTSHFSKRRPQSASGSPGGNSVVTPASPVRVVDVSKEEVVEYSEVRKTPPTPPERTESMRSSRDQSPATPVANNGRTAHQKPPRSFHSNNASAHGGHSGSPCASNATTDEEGGFNDPSPEIVARLRPHALAVTPALVDPRGVSAQPVDLSPQYTTVVSPQYTSVVSHASCYLQQSPSSVNGGSLAPSVGNTPTTPPSYVMPPACTTGPNVIKNSVLREMELEERRHAEEKHVTAQEVDLSALYSCVNKHRAEPVPVVPVVTAVPVVPQPETVLYHEPENNGYDDEDALYCQPEEFMRSPVQNSHYIQDVTAPDMMRSNNSSLDLQDVKYADADISDEESTVADINKQNDISDQNGGVDLLPDIITPPGSLSDNGGPETMMTPDEAEHLLSTRNQPLLSDEEAREITQLLAPKASSIILDTMPEEKIHAPESEILTTVSVAVAEPENPVPCILTDTTDETALASLETSVISTATDSAITMDDSMTSSRLDIMEESMLLTTSQVNESVTSSVTSLSGETSRSAPVNANTSSSSNIVIVTEDEPGIFPDYPPVQTPVVGIDKSGVHYFEDGHFWMEVPGLPETDDDEEDDVDYSQIFVKKDTKVKFSCGPMQVFSTFSVSDYDRRNEDVDPVAASAEYELEKRVEKMNVFPVQLLKGAEGLGLSIIGMGVGADAGLEKLGIFVKTITENGAAARDKRIQVNDQIIEVDGKSLVGVTQAYAASVLRNTSGMVRFLIGRERDPVNSEVAQLIKQSLQADKEREERYQRSSRHMVDHVRNTSDNSEDSTLPLSANSSVSDGPLSPQAVSAPGSCGPDSVFEPDVNAVIGNAGEEQDSLRMLLQETEYKLALSDEELTKLKAKLVELENNSADNEEYCETLRQSSAKLRESERNLTAAKKELSTYQEMLEKSQGQYAVLEKKYNRAKRVVREFQQRELDMIHREEFYQQLLQEKDTEYNALVKKLKDRVIELEQELQETQRKAGLPMSLPYDSMSLKQLTPQLSRREPPKPLFKQLDTELSDTEMSDASPEGEKTATVERKLPVKDELDRAVPQHDLLDVSANRSKGELGQRGGLANRQLPSQGKRSLSNSSSDYGLDESEASCDEEAPTESTSVSHTESTTSEQHTNSHSQPTQRLAAPVNNVTTTYNSIVNTSIEQQNLMHNSTEPIYIKEKAILSHHLHNNSNNYTTESIYSQAAHTRNNVPLNVATQIEPEANNGSVPQTQVVKPVRGHGPPSSLAEQLKQVLAEREKRLTLDGGSSGAAGDYVDPNKHSAATLVTQHLVEEIRQAVSEANAKVKKVVPQNLSPPGSVPWLQQVPGSPCSSGSISPLAGGYGTDHSPTRSSSMGDSSWSIHQQHHLTSSAHDLSTSTSSFGSDKVRSHFWQSAPVSEWSKEQVCQWLLALGLEQHISKFLENAVNGDSLLQLESRDFKILGVSGDDKNRLKRKLKELKIQVEKERKQLEKDRKERDKMMRKAEKLAEKASKRK